MITKLPPVGFKILQISLPVSLQIMHHFLSRLCWPLLKVHFAGHAHVKLVLDIGMCGSPNWECGSLVTNYPRAAAVGRKRWIFKDIFAAIRGRKDRIIFLNDIIKIW